MKLFFKLLTIAALALSFAQYPAAAKEEKKKKDSGKKKTDQPKQFDIPIPIGHKGEGLVIPYYNDKGKLQMNFRIDSATRTDADHLQMDAVKIETFDEKGQPEMSIDMPRSLLDIKTRVVTSDVPATIRRTDFEVTGDTLQFNTETRNGRMVGKVRMLIFKQDDEDSKTAHAQTNP